MHIADSGAPIKLYSVPTSNSQRVAIALEELGLAYEVRLLDRSRGELAETWFRAINPTALAPVIVDGSTTLAQSAAILVYLAEKTGRLLPPPGAARARAMQWLTQALSDVQASSSALFFSSSKVDAPHAPTVAVFEQRLADFLRHCDSALAHAEFLADDFSIADIALYPVCEQRRALIEERRLDNLAEWTDRLAERAAFRRGMQAVRGH